MQVDFEYIKLSTDCLTTKLLGLTPGNVSEELTTCSIEKKQKKRKRN